jgi:hypothetical protein
VGLFLRFLPLLAHTGGPNALGFFDFFQQPLVGSTRGMAHSNKREKLRILCNFHAEIPAGKKVMAKK